jgi:hypothetical protein|tara:strand:- start:449 stop:760 length:312 start_codon:yes stop_codon:yes gene_type:complete
MPLNDEKANKLLDMVQSLMDGDPNFGLDDENKVTLPYELLSFPEELGHEAWFVDPTTRTMVRLFNNTEVVRITDPDDSGKVIIKYSSGFASVPKGYVVEIGFN